MNRRSFLTSASTTVISATSVLAQQGPVQPGAVSKHEFYELRYFHLRNGTQPARTEEYFGRHWMPAARKMGIGPVGFFHPVLAPGSPFLLMLVSYSSPTELGSLHGRLMTDPDVRAAYSRYHLPMDPGFSRIENSFGKAFPGYPGLRLKEGAKPGRIFELRTYESNDAGTLARKIKMFTDGEASVFQRLGMQPVFFCENLVGNNLPSLTYMLSFDSLAARESLWSQFVKDSEFQKLLKIPGYSDAEIVSNISSSLLAAASFSDVL